ncbi:MAG: hypothetical protein ACP5EQ_07235 [Candidatus Cloacimonadia bacterium]
MISTDVDKKLKVLFVSYTFPPNPYGGTYRAMRACKGLNELGVEVHVLTTKPYNDPLNDYSLLEKIPGDIKIHRTRFYDPWRRYQKLRKPFMHFRWFKYLDRIISLLLWVFTVPDRMVLWIPFAISMGLRIIKQEGIKNVLVSSPPDSSQFIGYVLKRFAHAHFIADFRDPIVGNIAEVRLVDPKDLRSKIEKKIKKLFEHLIVRSADKIITNTETHRKELTSAYRLNNVITVRNSFDKDEYKGLNEKKYDIFTISHLGNMYGLRKVDVLFEALKLFKAFKQPDPLNVQILFVGNNSPELIQSAKSYGIEKYIKVHKTVPHRDALEIMMRSHLLLLVKATGKGSHGQIPGKFYEYLGSGNKILHIGPEASEVASIISDFDTGYTVESDSNKLFEILKNKYDLFNSSVSDQTDTKSINQFSYKNLAKKIHELFI